MAAVVVDDIKGSVEVVNFFLSYRVARLALLFLTIIEFFLTFSLSCTLLITFGSCFSF